VKKGSSRTVAFAHVVRSTFPRVQRSADKTKGVSACFVQALSLARIAERSSGSQLRLNPSFALTASQGGLLAQPPLAIPRGTRLRGPAGSLRCSVWRGPAELVAALLRHAAVLFPASPALLARV